MRMNEFTTKLIAWPETHEDQVLGRCVVQLAEADGPADESGAWPEPLWSLLVEAKAPRRRSLKVSAARSVVALNFSSDMPELPKGA